MTITDDIRSLAKAHVEAWRNSGSNTTTEDMVAEAIAATVERCAVVVQGDAADFPFQAALSEGADMQYGYYSARLQIAEDVRAKLQPNQEDGK